jgi:hypothetical protein
LRTLEYEILIVREVFKEGFFKAVLYDNGIIEIIWDETIEVIEVIHLNKIREAIFDLGGGQKMPLYFSAHDFLNISVDARKDAASDEGGKYTLANAVLIDSLAKKIVFNFFMTINKPKIPTKGFSNREDAFAWLSRFNKSLV